MREERGSGGFVFFGEFIRLGLCRFVFFGRFLVLFGDFFALERRLLGFAFLVDGGETMTNVFSGTSVLALLERLLAFLAAKLLERCKWHSDMRFVVRERETQKHMRATIH